MGFKEVATLDADNTVALGGRNKKTGKNNPTKAEGYYLGSRKVESKKSKTGYAFIHFLQTTNGNLGVWGKTDLDRKLTSVTPGTMVRITQTGMQATPNGDMYKYKVEQDSTNTIDVSGLAAANQGGGNEEETSTDEDEAYASASSDDDEEGNYDLSSEDDEEVEETPRVVAKAATADAAARKAKVQALLNKNKRVG
jgi:hypothetical protein